MSGEGSIYKRERTDPDGKTYIRHVAQLSLGARSDRRYRRVVCRTPSEARLALERMKAEQRHGGSLSRLSLGSYLRSWLDETVRPSVAPNTLRGYEDVLTHLRPSVAPNTLPVTALPWQLPPIVAR